ncbi:MAG TPA: SH3 domain-containing protein [Gammaproteobacteria bacterium]|nr:SH3 domain-containing protein [Gammaproteobacteria bacterium]
MSPKPIQSEQSAASRAGRALFVALLAGAAIAVARAADEQPIDRGSTVRPATVFDFPDRSGKPLGQLPPNAPLEVYERQRLWLRVKPPAGLAGPAGWVQLMDMRMGFGVAPALAPAAAAPARAAPVPAADPGMFASFSRSVSGLLAGFQSRPSSYAGSNATIGIRGLTGAELNASSPNWQALAEVERYAMPPQQAQLFANAGGLVPQHILYPTSPAPAPAAQTSPFERPSPFGGRPR